MALILRPDRVSLYNISSRSDEPESLNIDTTGKHWLCTPNREALISLSHVPPAARTKGDGQWVMDVFALEDCGADQPLFHKLMEQQPVFDLPSQVSHTSHTTTAVYTSHQLGREPPLGCWIAVVTVQQSHETLLFFLHCEVAIPTPVLRALLHDDFKAVNLFPPGVLLTTSHVTQGVAFTTTLMGGTAYLLAANGSFITALQLDIQSVRVEYTLKGAAAAAKAASIGPPRVNKLLNYVHSMCERFPVDDCIRIALHHGSCRTVPLQCITGPQHLTFLSPPNPTNLPNLAVNCDELNL